MPKKIRELEAALKKAGFICTPGKGSHRKWKHSFGISALVSGGKGEDAKRYQEEQIFAAIQAVKDQTNNEDIQP